MIIEISSLDDMELGLLAAVEGMVFQYGCGQTYQSPYAKGFQLLAHYGLRRQDTGGQWILCDEKVSELDRFMQDWNDRHSENWQTTDANLDYASLNHRSRHILSTLAQLANCTLMYPELGLMHHESMSAGEAAMWQLKAFNLIRLEAHMGRWTKRGEELLASYSDLGDFPA